MPSTQVVETSVTLNEIPKKTCPSGMKKSQELNRKNLNLRQSFLFVLFVGLFNLRGSDVVYNPVFFAYAMITQDEVT